MALLVATLGVASAQTLSPPQGAAPSAAATSPSPTAPTDLARSRVDGMLRSGHADAAWFSADFLKDIPAARVDGILAQLASTLGPYRGTDGTNGDYTARFDKGTIRVLIHLDADGRIDSLLFKPPAVSFEDALQGLRALGHSMSYVVREGGSERAAFEATRPLAVGSAFKLAVLAAIRDEVSRGRRRWADVIPLDGRSKSLPGGEFQNWPDATPITLSTYAAQMISVSDNTAADVLVRVAGSALAPYELRNRPFLTTREMFVLKSRAGAGLRAQYLAAPTAAEQAAVLKRVDALGLPAVADLEPHPILEIEWHYSVRELCDLMTRVADLPLMTINPRVVAEPLRFRRIAFKGGSDTGAINMTTQVVTKRGTTYCVAATLNDPTKPVDEAAFITAYGAVLGALADR